MNKKTQGKTVIFLMISMFIGIITTTSAKPIQSSTAMPCEQIPEETYNINAKGYSQFFKPHEDQTPVLDQLKQHMEAAKTECKNDAVSQDKEKSKDCRGYCTEYNGQKINCTSEYTGLPEPVECEPKSDNPSDWNDGDGPKYDYYTVTDTGSNWHYEFQALLQATTTCKCKTNGVNIEDTAICEEGERGCQPTGRAA